MPATADEVATADGRPVKYGASPGRSTDTGLRLMAVHAHPDDESSKGAATMARYVRSGAEVLVATLTGGERGDILNKAMERPEVRANLPRIRREEMARAREILGVQQRFLGFTDSGLPEGDPLPPLPDGCFALEKLEDAAEPLVRLVREFRPHVLLTYDENGGYPHPDHVKTHEVAIEAFEAAADPDRYPGSGGPGSRSSSTTSPRSTRPGSPRCMRNWCVAGSSHRMPSGSRTGRTNRRGVKHWKSPRRYRAAPFSASATRRCSRTPPRSTRRVPGSPARRKPSRPRGRPRITIWPGHWWILSFQRMICSLASGRG